MCLVRVSLSFSEIHAWNLGEFVLEYFDLCDSVGGGGGDLCLLKLLVEVIVIVIVVIELR